MWVDNLHNSPLVSVIMNAHNSEEFLAEAIKSVVEQTYQKWEIILWDNASKDESQSIAESFGDSRIHYHEIPGKVSLYTSRINAINHASGDLIAFLDCDDTWTPNKLTRQVPIFEDNSIVASCTDYYVHIEGDDLRAVEQDRVARTYRDKRVSLEQIVSEYRVGMLTLMVRRSSCLQFLPQQPPEFSIVEDLDIVTRVLQSGDLAPLSVPLATYRLHQQNFSRDTSLLLNERALWLQDFLTWCPPTTSSAKAARSFESETLKVMARESLLQGRRSDCRQSSTQMLFGAHRLKYLFASLLPLSWIRRWL